jgi:hypothetical protein
VLKSKWNYKQARNINLDFVIFRTFKQQMTMTVQPLHAVEFMYHIKHLYHTRPVLTPRSKRETNTWKQSTQILTSLQSVERNGNKRENPQKEAVESHGRKRGGGNEKVRELSEHLESCDGYYCCVECSENDNINTQSSECLKCNKWLQ